MSVAVAVCEFWFETTKTPLSLIVAPVSVTVTGHVANSNRDRQEREERQECQYREERQERDEREELQEREEHEERQECQSGLDGHQFHATLKFCV